MKTPFFVALAIAFGVSVSFGQGSTVNFNNTVTTFPADGIDRSVYSDFFRGIKLVGTNYAAALYWGTTLDAITQLAVLNATDTSLTSARGLFRLPTTVNPGTWSGGARTLLGTTLGQQVFMQVRVWDHTQFVTYADAIAGGGVTGASSHFTYTTSSSPTPPPSDLVLLNLRAFTVPIVPEPSYVGLGMLGLGILFMFRRRT